MGKWVEVDDIEAPASRVAANILSERLELVAEKLPLAAFHASEDVEHVHQLRVGCRRSGAALQSFRSLLGRRAKPLRKLLREIRRAAGPARDADVLLERLHAEPETRACHEYVVERLEQRRVEAQPALVAVAEEIDATSFKKTAAGCLKTLRKRAKREDTSFSSYAREALQTVADEMFERARVEELSVPQLHQLRIAGKRMRYSIELFHVAMPETLRYDIYPVIEEVQARLGRLNDHATAQALFQHWLADMPADERGAQLAARIVAEHEAAMQVRDEFLAWWTTKRMSSLESKLQDLLHVES